MENQKESWKKLYTCKYYAERFINKVFLLSKEQYHSLYKNRSVLGFNYHKAQMIKKGSSHGDNHK